MSVSRCHEHQRRRANALVVAVVGAALITAVKEVVVLTGETPSANSVEVDEGVAPFWHLAPVMIAPSIRRGCLDGSVGLHVRMREHQQE
jgi:hypothetical protein